MGPVGGLRSFLPEISVANPGTSNRMKYEKESQAFHPILFNMTSYSIVCNGERPTHPSILFDKRPWLPFMLIYLRSHAARPSGDSVVSLLHT